jgi:hypothetical protein
VGENLEFNVVEGSFGAINKNTAGGVYLWGHSLRDHGVGVRKLIQFRW